MSAEGLVLSLIKNANKPFGLQGVTDMLATKGVKKAQAQKALDALSEANKLVVKEFGKTKIWFPPQNQVEALSKEATEQLAARLKALQEEAQSELGVVKSLEQELSDWQSSMSEEEIRAQTSRLSSQLQEQRAKLAKLQSGTVLISAEERAKVEKLLAAGLEAWRKRRMMFREIWGTISEGVDGKPSELLEEMGVETDEAVGADYRALEAMLPKKRRL